MSEQVPADQIETIVGVQRDAMEHYGRSVSSERTVYILHSQECKDSTPDLRECPFSVALDRGIEDLIPWAEWRWVLDQPVPLEIALGYLMPKAE